MRVKARILVSLVLIAGLLCGGFLVAQRLIRTRPKPPSRTVRKVVPRVEAPPVSPRIDHRVRIVGYGSARPRVRIELSPLVSGQVIAKAENFLTGKGVRKKQVLFEIDPTDFEIAKAAAESQSALHRAQLSRLDQDRKNLRETEKIERRRLALAKSQLDKVHKLRARGAAVENEVDAAEDQWLAREGQLRVVLDRLALIPPQRKELEAQLAIDQTRLRQATTDLERATVRAPVTGRVLRCTMEAGERVQAGQVCGEIYGTRIMEVPVSIPADDLAWLDPATVARCLGGGEPNMDGVPDAEIEWMGPSESAGMSWKGRIGRIEAGLEAETRTAIVVVYVKNPPATGRQPLLDVNMFCKVRILGKTLPKAYLLPRKAVLPDRHPIRLRVRSTSLLTPSRDSWVSIVSRMKISTPVSTAVRIASSALQVPSPSRVAPSASESFTCSELTRPSYFLIQSEGLIPRSGRN